MQKVYFRANVVSHAKELGLVGWVANSLRGTVVGEVQGPQEQMALMKVQCQAQELNVTHLITLPASSTA